MVAAIPSPGWRALSDSGSWQAVLRVLIGREAGDDGGLMVPITTLSELQATLAENEVIRGRA